MGRSTHKYHSRGTPWLLRDGFIIYDKDGNDLKVPTISESQYQEGVKKEMDKVLAFLKENEPEYYDIMLEWREDNGKTLT